MIFINCTLTLSACNVKWNCCNLNMQTQLLSFTLFQVMTGIFIVTIVWNVISIFSVLQLHLFHVCLHNKSTIIFLSHMSLRSIKLHGFYCWGSKFLNLNTNGLLIKIQRGTCCYLSTKKINASA